MYSLDRLESLSHTKAIISNEVLGVKCLLTGVPSFNTSADFGESALANILSATQTEASLLVHVIQAFTKTGGVIPQMRLQHNVQTMKMWQGSRPFGFTISCIFIASRQGHNPIIPLLNLMSGTLPLRTSEFFLQAPLAYTVGRYADTAAGTWSVTIGQWFAARSLVMQSLEWTPSKEITANGTPLYVEASMNFETFRVMDIQEVRSFFPALSGTDPWTSIEDKDKNAKWSKAHNMPISVPIPGIKGNI